jgi:hypothetical protein
MTTENRAIRIGGMVDDISVGGVEINTHRTTSCGFTAVAQETGQTNIHIRSLHGERAKCNPFPTASDVILVTRVRGIQENLWEKSEVIWAKAVSAYAGAKSRPYHRNVRPG